MGRIARAWLLVAFANGLMANAVAGAGEFRSDWSHIPDRVWIGPEFWANPMEDWRVEGGKLECVTGNGNRNVHVLTRELAPVEGTLHLAVRLGLLDIGNKDGSAGFRIGIQDEIDDYRARCLRGNGIDAGISTDGKLFLGTQSVTFEGGRIPASVLLQVKAEPAGKNYLMVLTAADATSGKNLGSVTTESLQENQLRGNIALVQNFAERQQGPRFWFDDWKISGTKVAIHDERRFGPVLWAMHTLSRGVLKMTAQMPPLGAGDSRTVALQLQHAGSWETVSEQTIDPLSRTATFRLKNWDSTREVPYRLAYVLGAPGGATKVHHYSGTVRREPLDRDLVIAGFTGNTDTGFPNREIVRNVGIMNPDVLFFSGDQIYENVGGYGIIRTPVERSILNYLRKWYLLGWAFGDLMRDRVTVCMPDDHDVYQGNIWGDGGHAGGKSDDVSGYIQAPEWVNAVQRTQTSHLPDPYDPTPIDQGISVYYTSMLYGRISFAIVEDRKFKSGPERVATWPGRHDWLRDSNVDVKSLDKAGLNLLGDRQLKFLRDWAADWRGADMKMVLSQTIFCSVANYHGPEKTFLIADLDSNGWPQTGRNRALVEMRKGFALHLAGDQHLPSIVQHGIEGFRDAIFSFCVPSIAAGYPRSWRPDKEGRPVRNRPAPGLADTGDYLDGFGNRVTVFAVGNPAEKNRRGRINTLHDKSSGFGIVRMHKKDFTITLECWRLLFDANHPRPEDQFPGWPRTLSMMENDGRPAAGYLPAIRISGVNNPVIQVIDEADRDIVYTLRIHGDTFRPKVFKQGRFTVKISEPETGRMREVSGVEPAKTPEAGSIEVRFP